MSDIAANSRPMKAMPGEQAMVRLADRLAALAPQEPLSLTSLQATSMPRPSPAVATSKAISARAAERARRSRSVTGLMVDGFIAACALVPYALIALALRVLMAAVFFFDGQSRIDGTRLVLNLHDVSFALTLPMQLKPDVLADFVTRYPPLPVPPTLAAYAVAYSEFTLPALLVLGLATRFAALSLLALTAFLALYVTPQALWTAHVFWAGILLVLISRGPGEFSLDAVIRWIARR